jgi:sRNA-binding regulator protein Hfq
MTEGGPDFIRKLKDEHVTIDLHNGGTLRGTIVAFNRYEILFQVDEESVPIVLMKNFIYCIQPDKNVFAEKVSEEVLQL